MAYTSIYKDIIFVEGDNAKAERKQPIKTDLMGIGAQFKNLNHVKEALYNQATTFNCNCILDFKYGQKSSWLSIDDVKYYGSGVCSVLPKDEYDRIIEQKK
jgi:hypothetical protein